MLAISYPTLRAETTVNPAPPVRRYPTWLIAAGLLGLAAVVATFYIGPRITAR